MMATLRVGVIGWVLMLAGMSAAFAVDQTVILKLGKNSTLVLDSAFETVIVGNPEVVDVHTQGDRSVILEPLRFGASNILFVDRRSIAVANVRVFVCHIVRTEYREGSDCD